MATNWTRTARRLALAAALLPGWALAAYAGDAVGFDETVERIERRLERQGFRIEAVIDHAAAADSVGLALPPTKVVLFGSRRSDTSLLRRGTGTALDLPLRFLIFEDDEGVKVTTNRAGFLIDRHRIPIFDFRLGLTQQVLDQFGLGDDGIVEIESERGFADTLEALLATLDDRGFRIPLTIDYAERASDRRRRRLPPTTLVVFGNPNVGTPLMQSQREIALDLPQKMLVRRDRRGRVLLTYNDPRFLARKHDLRDQDARIANIANALRNIAETAAGTAP